MIPKEFKEYRQWVSWRPVEREGKISKIPMTRDNRNASTTNPDTWDEWENIKSCERKGFVFTRDDPFIFIDLDNCIDKNGNLEPWAEKIVKLIDSHTEYSPSMKGLHIFCIGQLKKPGNRYKNIEIYDSKRYSTLTGKVFPRCRETIEERQKQIDTLHRKYFPKEYEEPRSTEHTSSNLEDDEILEIARNAQNAVKFLALWNGDTSGYDSYSEADMALCSIFAFYTQDENQIDRLFRQSVLCRKKWDREDYRRGIFEKILRGRTQVYGPSIDKVKDYNGKEEETYQHPQIYTVNQIVQMELEPPRFIIPDLITEGLNLVIGKAKAGKSAYVRQAGCAIAFGGKAFGDFQATGSEVLYLDLEETLNMFQHKVKKLLNGVDAPNGYHVSCRETIHQWGKIGHGFSERAIDYLEKHPNIKVLIIDTYGRIKPRSNEKQSDGGYLDETRIVGVLMLLLNYVDCIILVHHSKKGKSEDWIDDVLGSTGLAAAADTIIRIHRDRGEIDSQIDITGKAIKEQTFKAKFLDEKWEILGIQKDWSHLTPERKDIYEVFHSVENNKLRPQQVADRLDKERSNINNIMLTMTGKGQLERVKTGRYRIPEDIYRRWKEDHVPISVDDFLEKIS